jgi:hypothetical protein
MPARRSQSAVDRDQTALSAPGGTSNGSVAPDWQTVECSPEAGHARRRSIVVESASPTLDGPSMSASAATAFRSRGDRLGPVSIPTGRRLVLLHGDLGAAPKTLEP